MKKTAISPKRDEDYPEWYQQVIKAADLAETSPVRGCMVIKPWGYAIWENIQKTLDEMLKESGHQNAYFPLFIPLSHLEKEAKHVDGFAKECAVVTHTKLEQTADGKLKPSAKLDEPLIVRPTSETIIGEMFSQWVQSYRDLPLLINQWANVVRWELRTRMFLRTTEFLWQEGHTAHATKEEAWDETTKMLEIYSTFCREYLAIPVIEGKKSENERFPGAEETFCIEAMMQDRKALQAGTSHFLGQNFAKASDISYLDESGTQQHAWTTSWGVTTRLIGGLIMSHSDDNGLVLPPKIAPAHVVLLPILHKKDKDQEIINYCEKLKSELEAESFDKTDIKVIIDKRDLRGGEKKWQWIKKGIPVWIEVGPKDIESGTLILNRRDQSLEEKTKVTITEILSSVKNTLSEIQKNIFNKALQFRNKHTKEIHDKNEFERFFTAKESEIHGGFALTYWAGDSQLEDQIKKEFKVTIRCLLLEESKKGKCPFTGKETSQKAIFAKAY